MNTKIMFHGSYLKEDVSFLVKVIDMKFTQIDEKERLIQSGMSHYSQMLSPEYEPSLAYLEIFYQAYADNKKRFASDILTLAYHLSQKKNIVLVSLLRAGTPIGVLLKRTLRDVFDTQVNHYSISIIRDREIDELALKYILKENPESEFIFIDGWTGKGVINRELKVFIKKFNEENKTNISDKLYVISDIASVSDFAVNNDDYLIPSSALNSTISGLVSRSILNDEHIKEGDFHGCKYYAEYAKSDLSLWFIDEITTLIKGLTIDTKPLVSRDSILRSKMRDFLLTLQKEWQISDINHIKPGIGESTRVLLRRVPYVILVQNLASQEIGHLLLLAKEKEVEVIEDKALPYKALAIIKNMTKDSVEKN
ncbi:MAG: cysteine protease StiP family protein [Sulfurovum sp.]|nr:cysteine protease StiP family protein [Sulfurovum sp.]